MKSIKIRIKSPRSKWTIKRLLIFTQSSHLENSPFIVIEYLVHDLIYHATNGKAIDFLVNLILTYDYILVHGPFVLVVSIRPSSAEEGSNIVHCSVDPFFAFIRSVAKVCIPVQPLHFHYGMCMLGDDEKNTATVTVREKTQFTSVTQ